MSTGSVTSRHRSGGVDQWPIELETVIQGRRAELLHEVLLATFGPLRDVAAARHLLDRAEFDHELADPRIRKYTVWRSPSEPVALFTLTNQLAAMPWISPEFWTSRYPEQAARQAVYYLGIALVVPEPGQFRLFERIVETLVADCVAAKGVIAFDVSRFNDTRVQFSRRTVSILNRIAPCRVGVADTQVYYEAVFE